MRVRRILKWSALTIVLAACAAGTIAWLTSTNDCGQNSGDPGERMKAVVYCDYGPPEVLRLEDVARPIPSDNQVLLKVRAASVNPLDWHYMRGTPYIARVMGMGFRKPKLTRLGKDVAGRVEAVGRNVTRWKPGDEVFGSAHGAFAEYAVASERVLARKPANLTFAQAAALPIAAITALQGLRDKGKLQRGQTVLINGASGGVGTYAVQIARSFGAHVTGVCSTRNVEMVRSLGAEQVIDYTKQDFTRLGQRYDLILDNVGNQSLSACRRALQPKGRYVMVGGQPGNWLSPLDRALGTTVLSWFVSQDMGLMMAAMTGEDLSVLRDLAQAGTITPVIDKTFPLSQVPEAVRYLETGHARGKVVIVVSE